MSEKLSDMIWDYTAGDSLSKMARQAEKMESSLAQAQADVEALRPLRDSLLEIRELLGPDSGYHISPDKAPEGLGELMRIGAIFERADSALAALLEHLRGASK